MAVHETIKPRPTDKEPSSVGVAMNPEDGSEVEKQTRTRRIFSFPQLFAFSLTYMALWEGMCT